MPRAGLDNQNADTALGVGMRSPAPPGRDGWSTVFFPLPFLLANVFLLLGAVGGCSSDAKPGAGFKLPPPAVSCLAFSPRGDLVAAGVNDTVILWDPDTGKEQNKFFFSGAVVCLAFDPDGKRLAVGLIEQPDMPAQPQANLGRNKATGRGIKTPSAHLVKLVDARTGKEWKTLSGHRAPLNAIAFSPDGTTLASGGGESNPFNPVNEIKLWNGATGTHLANLPDAQKGIVHALAFSPDGKTLASGHASEVAILWDVGQRKQVQTLTGHTRAVTAVAFADNGKILATGSGDDTAMLWDAHTGKKITSCKGHEGRITCLAMSPDGTVMATGSDDKTVQLWDMPGGGKQNRLDGHTRGVSGLAFGTGSRLASASADGTVRLWDIKTGKEIRMLK
jgi:WD40 repeat protein